MDYQIKEGVNCIRTELKAGEMKIMRNKNHVVRLSSNDISENSMRVFTYNNILYIKCLTPEPIRLELHIPESVRSLYLNSEGCSFSAENIEFDNIITCCRGTLEFTKVKINKSCRLSVDEADIRLKACEIRSMNIEITDGIVDFQNTLLRGNNTAFLHNATIGGLLQGALVDYVVSAGAGVSPDNIIVNDHLLTEFPSRKNTQNCAWLLIAGSLKNTVRLTIQKPRVRY